MTNKIYIDIDTERERQIMFSKPPDIAPPTNRDEARDMIIKDISSVSEALKTLITMATENSYAINSELIAASIKTIKEAEIPETNELKKEA